MNWVWHKMEDLPCPSAPLVVKTNQMGYYICVRDMEKKWWVKVGKRYSEAEKVLSGNEKITAWAYVGGES